MQLTKFSDYALRVLMFTHAAGDRLVTIEEVADAYGISRAHLMKVVNVLTRAGYLKAVRGRSGGLRLAMPADKIGLGNVVRSTEPDFALVECFATGNQCVITGCCRLAGVLHEALDAFEKVLDKHTLASLALRPKDFARTMGRAESATR
jgi:Rrf2 family transcriptional regulator, nitric oxide-sensitive transcriptional repressor